MAIAFFERSPDEPELLRPASRENLVMQQHLLTLAELFLPLGFALPLDPARTAAMGEQLLEAHYASLCI